MKKHSKILFLTLAVMVLICLTAITFAACNIFGGKKDDGPEIKTITLSPVSEALVGEKVELSVSANFSPFYTDALKFNVVGENPCKAEVERGMKNNNPIFFLVAKLPGTVTVKASYYQNSQLVCESNESKITFSADNTISTVSELKALADSDKSYILIEDLDLSDEGDWTPISNFKGSLSTDGHSIKNLKLRVRSNDNVGLFAELKGIVDGITIEGLSITGSGSGSNVGAIAGKNSGTIKNCEVNGSIDVEYSTCVGGIAGYSNVQLYDNVNNATVKSNEKVGGIAGCIVSTGSLQIKGNTNNGDITGAKYVGGVAGSMEGQHPKTDKSYTSTILDCTNNGKVIATGDYAGGIAGQVIGSYYEYFGNHYIYLELSDCENNGSVEGKDYVAGIYGFGGEYVKSVTACVNTEDVTGSNYVGGYIGYSNNTTLSNMNNNITVTGKGYVGGIAGYVGKIENCKNNGNVISKGTILEDSVNKYCLGGIAGYCTGVVKCENNVDISATLSGINIGGIAGYICCDNSVENCTNTGKITATQCEKVGGIAGNLVPTGNRTISGNTNESDISGSKYVGGIVGSLESDHPGNDKNYTTTISDCTNNGKVTATGDYAGGIAGQAIGNYYSWYRRYVYLELSDCENNGLITGKDYVAGIYGYGGNYVKSVTACINTKDITGGNYVGSYIGYSNNTALSNMNNNNTITGKGYVGGIAGYAGKVQNCKNNASVISLGTILEDNINKYCVGGIAGYCTGAVNCENSVDLTLDLAGNYVGGIAGYISCDSSVETCTNKGNVTATQCEKVGGIAGYIITTESLQYKDNTNESNISGSKYVGGIVGLFESDHPGKDKNYTSTISDCVNNGNISATGDYAGGIAGQAVGDYYSSYRRYLYLQFSSNSNYGSVSAGGSNRAAIVGKVGDYVNSQNSSLWSSNNDYGNVGKLYN